MELQARDGWIEDGKIIARYNENCEDMSSSKRHLYLVLEDWEQGYTIRKIDVESFDAASGDGGGGIDANKDPEVLPEPPVIRVEAEHGQAALFTALGTRILALQRSAGAGVPVFDTATLGLAVAPQPQGDALANSPTLVAIGGDRIYGLEGTKAAAAAGDRELRHFEVLRAPAPPGRTLWSWSAVPAPPPFNPSSVLCHAAHPDGRTVFFSAECAAGSKAGGSGTFSFNTQRLEWTCHGNWLLPFTGQAHYDAKLDAWVGICGGDTDTDGDDAGAARGRVCSCGVVAPGRRRVPAPECKLGAEPLFCEDEKRHVGAALVYMGDSRFCLLECVKPKPRAARTKKVWKEKPRESNGHSPTDPSDHLLHVTAFGYGDQGELTAAAARRQRRSYAVPQNAAKFLEKPVAFWM
ncbi:hypothetical protein SETIT_5G134000v2 [Setaria italica]|uniref:DUF1618 domain-containing protein n=2 Tax=Setaria italica TaxID=4555 RepID=A0A368R4G7_SETIT|nr:hypothetical protein SETIT_5G134000v2 [Setaria italica]